MKAAPSYHVGAWERYKLIEQIQTAAQQARAGEFGIVAQTLMRQNLSLEDRYSREVVPAMEVIKAAKALVSDERWAYGLFVPDMASKFGEDMRKELEAARRVSNGKTRGEHTFMIWS